MFLGAVPPPGCGVGVGRAIQDKKSRPVSAGTASINYSAALFEQLRAKRKEIADAEGIPAYIILHDRSLMEMAAYFPDTADAFGQIYGIGEAKVTKSHRDERRLEGLWCWSAQ